MVRIRRSHRRGPGSIPGVGMLAFFFLSREVKGSCYVEIMFFFWVVVVVFGGGGVGVSLSYFLYQMLIQSLPEAYG